MVTRVELNEMSNSEIINVMVRIESARSILLQRISRFDGRLDIGLLMMTISPQEEQWASDMAKCLGVLARRFEEKE